MTDYAGFNLLEKEPMGTPDREDALARSMLGIDHGYGKQWHQALDAQPRYSIPFAWPCYTHADIAALKTWFLARKGSAVPFWAPTWRRDLQLTADMASTDLNFTIENIRYTDLMFPANARRRLAFITPSRVIYCRKVTNAVATSADTETLTLDASLGVAFSKGYLVSFLMLVRLTDDKLSLSYATDSKTESTLGFIELPLEVPA